MEIKLRKLRKSDINFFGVWWRDQELVALTSGHKEQLADQKVQIYFDEILKDQNAKHFMIDLGAKTIGHIALTAKDANWHEIQVVIGEKGYWGNGYGPHAINLLLKIAGEEGIHKVYLEVRPNNKRAITAYEKCGFKKTGLLEHPENPNLPVTLRMERII